MSDTEVEVQIRTLMRKLMDADPGGWIDRPTQLAEEAAQQLGHDEWLDDEHHVVWTVAVEVCCVDSADDGDDFAESCLGCQNEAIGVDEDGEYTCGECMPMVRPMPAETKE